MFAFGCASTKTIPYTPYTPVQGSEPWFAEAGPKVFIHEFDNETAGEISHGFDKSVEVSKRIGENILRSGFFFPFNLMLPDKQVLPVNRKNIQHTPPNSVGLLVAQIVRNCLKMYFTKEFQALGLQVVENVSEAQAIMKGKILRFASMPRTYRGPVRQVISASVDLSLEFVDQNGNLLLQQKISCAVKSSSKKW